MRNRKSRKYLQDILIQEKLSQKLFNCGTYCFLRFEAYAERQTIHKAITYLADSRQTLAHL